MQDVAQERADAGGRGSVWKRLGRRFWRTYYAFKYLPFRGHRPGVEVPLERRGYVCIQIDGLAYEYLLLAMRRGYMRHLRRWWRRGKLALQRFRPGLPTSTPNAQAGMLFGVEENIPAFRWYERERRQVINCNDPAGAQFIRDEIVGQRAGALEGGSSYVNFLDGGAERTVFTVAGSHDDSVISRLGGVHLLFLLVFHPIRILRTIIASFRELWAEAYDRWLRPDPEAEQVEHEGLFPLLRVISNVLLRELQTLGLLVDVHSDVPCIFTTYSGYDELGHHFGPASRAALTNLRHIDRRIAEVYRMMRLGASRRYDLIILSDHGQTAARPFSRRFGRTVGEEIGRQLQVEPVQVSGGPDDRWDRHAQYLAREVSNSPLARVPGVRPATRAVVRHVERRALLSMVRPGTVYVDERAGAVVTCSGSLAHLYLLADGSRRMDYDRIVELYPGLVPYLRRHEGIGPFFVRQAPGRWLVMEAENSAELLMPAEEMDPDEEGPAKDLKRSLRRSGDVAGGGMHSVKGLDPLRHVDPDHENLGELCRFLGFRNAGDVVLFGRYDGERVICFDDQVGAHSSLGGPQAEPFIMLPAGHPASGDTLRGYAAIYHRVLRPYLRSAIARQGRDSERRLSGQPVVSAKEASAAATEAGSAGNS